MPSEQNMDPVLFSDSTEAMRAVEKAISEKKVRAFDEVMDATEAGEEQDGWPDELLYDRENRTFYVNYFLTAGDAEGSAILKVDANGEVSEVKDVPEDVEDLSDYIPDIES